MNGRRSALLFGVVVFLVVMLGTAVLFAQTSCSSGAGELRSDYPGGLSPQQIIAKFAANESIYKAAQTNYTYTQDITVQTLSGITSSGKPIVDGEFRQVMEVSYDSRGRRSERVTFAPPSTLRRISLSMNDLEDMRELMPYSLTSDQLPNYDVVYRGQQRVDELETYVFDVAPKSMRDGVRYFEGRLWVESRDLAVVKTCGKSVPNVVASKKSKREQDVSPKFVTYREQIDGRWFPTYTRSDDFLLFSTGHVRIREIIKYKDYHRSAQLSGGEAFRPAH